MMKLSNFILYKVVGLVVFSLSLNAMAQKDSNQTLFRPYTSTEGIDGAKGQLYVYGSLVESPCKLAMTSKYQEIDLGIIGTAELQNIGKVDKSIPFSIELIDCIRTPASAINKKLGTSFWSHIQPSVKINFYAKTVPFNPNLVSVTGAEGFGLAILDKDKKTISLNEYTTPEILQPGQNILTYNLAPVRISQDLKASNYTAIIYFLLSYE